MAERGSKTPLDEEIRAAKAEGTADKLLSGDGIARSPASVSLDFVIRRDHPLVTLVSMVAPSPDWFGGVSALSLLEGDHWVNELRVELFAYDAGTDSGTTYDSANRPTSPREPIQQIEGRPLAVRGAVAPVGTNVHFHQALSPPAAKSASPARFGPLAHRSLARCHRCRS